MENNIKKRILMTLIENLRKNDEMKYISMWNEMCEDNYECDRMVRENTDSDLADIRIDYFERDYAEMLMKSKYNKNDRYITQKDGIIHSFNNVELFTSVNEIVVYLIDCKEKPTWYDINNYTYVLNFDENKEYISFALTEYDKRLSPNDIIRYFNENDIYSVADVMLIEFATMVKEIKNPQPKAFLTKQDVWDAMRNLLKGRETCEGWKDTLVFDLDCNVRLVCWGVEVDNLLIEIVLRKNRYEQDVIALTSVWYDEDGTENREYDNIMDLSFEEMCRVYDKMLKNL